MKSLITMSSVVWLLVGCGQHPVEEARSKAEDLAAEICACPEVVTALGYASEGECIRDNSTTLSETELACVKAAYDRNESTASPAVSCTNDEAQNAIDCFRDASCNLVALERCNEILADDTCPNLPTSVQEEFDACFP